MSADAVRWAKRVTAGGPGHKAVLLVLADFADESHSCFPSQRLLAEVTEQGERTVRRQLAELEARGLLARSARHREEGRGRTSDRFVLAVGDQAAKLAGETTNRPFTTDQPAIHDRPTGQSLAGDISTREPPITTSSRAFDAFWDTYPRKVAKGAARVAWPKALRAAGGDATRIISGAMRFASDPNRDPAFTPHPSTWLRAERWDDDPLPPRLDGRRPPIDDDDLGKPHPKWGLEAEG